MKKQDLVIRATELGISFDESKATIDTLKKLIESKEAEKKVQGEKHEDEPLSLLQVINNTIATLKKDIDETKIKLERDKKAGNDIEETSKKIKSLKTKIKDLTILSCLYMIKDKTETVEYFKETKPENAIGQYYNFNLDSAKKLIIMPEDMDFSEDFTEMEKALPVIQSTIKIINESNIYENIYKDILPRYINDESIVDFAECKKHIENFVKENNAMFASGINVCINNNDAKTFITAVLKISKSHNKNSVNLALFKVFLNEFQKMIATKVNKINMKIALMKK